MASNTVWKLPYTAEQIQAAQKNLIPIVGANENWWRWDIQNMKWVDTGTRASPAIVGDIGSNPNLLHNWYFADPINQRGLTEYSGAVYAIDRWACVDGVTVSLSEDGITLTSTTTYALMTLHQRIPRKDLISGKYTLSALYYDENGTLAVSATTFGLVSGENIDTPETEMIPGWYVDLYGDSVADPSCYFIRVVYAANYPVASQKIKAVKLELGSQQTLARQDEEGNWVLNDPPPDKNMELLKCCMSTADPNDPYANNKVTAAAVGAVNKAGDTMSGSLYFKRVSLDRQNALIPWEDGLHIRDLIDEANYSDLIIRQEGWPIAVRIIDGSYVSGEVFNDANKPAGSFTGNGSSATRTIETGGLGNVILVYGNDQNAYTFCAIYTRNGGFGRYRGNAYMADWTSTRFEDGVLTVATYGNGFNENGCTYYYQVL